LYVPFLVAHLKQSRLSRHKFGEAFVSIGTRLKLGIMLFEGLTECTERDPLAFGHMNDVVADVDEQGG